MCGWILILPQLLVGAYNTKAIVSLAKTKDCNEIVVFILSPIGITSGKYPLLE